MRAGHNEGEIAPLIAEAVQIAADTGAHFIHQEAERFGVVSIYGERAVSALQTTHRDLPPRQQANRPRPRALSARGVFGGAGLAPAVVR
jgi:hypothetical protein